MENVLTTNMNNKHWWLQMLLGIAFIGFGFWFWFTPVETYITLAFFFSAWMFVTGVFEIFNAIGASKHSGQWVIYLIGGIIDIVVGVILMTHENLTMEILPIFLGFWLLFRSIMMLVFFFEIKNKLKGITNLLLISPVLSGIFALIILAKPIIGDLSIVYATAFAFFFMGIYRLVLGNNQRKSS